MQLKIKEKCNKQKINEPLARLPEIKERREKSQILGMKWDITADPTAIRRIIGNPNNNFTF
jgi:hypothetical protein